MPDVVEQRLAAVEVRRGREGGGFVRFHGRNDREGFSVHPLEKVERFLEKLDDNDDVQEFFHNGILPEDEEE